MKNVRLLTGIVLAVTLGTGLTLAQSGYDLFQKGLVKERAEGDMKAAIEIFERIVKEFPNNRELAAKALVEMGDCYEKLGKSDALKAYQRVLHDYADQSAEAKEARTRLAALDHGGAHGSELVMRRIWAGSDVDYEGAPTSEGKYLTYTDWDTGDLAVRNLVTGQESRLTHKGPWTESNDFAEYSVPSPDGKHVAYAWCSGDGYGLRVINIDGSHMRILLKNEPNGYVEPKAWTPDGKQILATIWPKDGNMQIAMVSVADGSVTVLRNFQHGDPRQRLLMLAQMCISSDGRYIAYSLSQNDDEYHRDIFLLPTDGGSDLPVVTNPADDYFLGWAPDGKTMVFASDRTGATGAWAIKVIDGKPAGSPKMLKTDVGNLQPLGFTRDGSFYYALNDTVRDLYLVSLDLASGKVLERPEPVSRRFTGRNSAPAWSADGKYLAYLSLRHRPWQFSFPNRGDTIIIHSFETGKEREVVPKLEELHSFAGLVWSPDDQYLVVHGADHKDRRGSFRIDAKTGAASMLLANEPGMGGQRFCCLTPDDQSFIYVQAQPKGAEVAIRDLSSGQSRELFPARYWFGGLALSPDGRELALSTQAQHSEPDALIVLPVAGGPPRTLYRLKKSASFGWDTVSWTRDGKHIVFGVVPGGLDASDQKTELWEIAADGSQPHRLDITADTIRQLRVSPDGHDIAFTTGAFSSEIGVMENLLPTLKASR